MSLIYSKFQTTIVTVSFQSNIATYLFVTQLLSIVFSNNHCYLSFFKQTLLLIFSKNIVTYLLKQTLSLIFSNNHYHLSFKRYFSHSSCISKRVSSNARVPVFSLISTLMLPSRLHRFFYSVSCTHFSSKIPARRFFGVIPQWDKKCWRL